MTGTRPRLGAYGLHLVPSPPSRWLVEAPASWPTIRLHHEGSAAAGCDPPRATAARLADGVAHVDAGGDWRLRVDLDGRVAAYRDLPVESPELVHPGLAATAAILHRWWGHRAYHAGGVIVEGGAYGVVGDRGAGKTTLLAACAARGLPVLADDLLVVADGHALAGPRCLDLREAPSADVAVTRVRDGVRHRMTLPPVPASAPLAGWVFLRWGGAVATQAAPVRDRLRLLADAASWLVQSQDPVGLLDDLPRPAWWLTRPRDRRLIDEGVDTLLATLSG